MSFFNSDQINEDLNNNGYLRSRSGRIKRNKRSLAEIVAQFKAGKKGFSGIAKQIRRIREALLKNFE